MFARFRSIVEQPSACPLGNASTLLIPAISKCDLRILVPWCVLLIGISLLQQAAVAEDALMPGESVADRPRPRLDPTGMPIGAFRLFPSLELSAKSESNIFADRTGEIDDVILGLKPTLRLESNWARHSLTASTTAHLAQYRTNEQEDFDDAAFNADFRLGISRSSALLLSAGYEIDHEERFSPDDVFGIEPTEFSATRFSAAYARRTGKFSMYVGTRGTVLDYDDVVGITGPINNDDRDRTELRHTFRAGYEVHPDIDVLLRVDYGANDYDGRFEGGEQDRSADSRTAALGIRGALTGALYAEVFAGYVEHEYDNPAFASFDSSWFEARVVWNVSGLTTLTLDGTRGIEETTLSGASGYKATRFGLSVDHELLRNLIVHVNASLRVDRYSRIDREDDNTWYRLGVRYLVNRYVRLGLDIQQRERDSVTDPAGAGDFTNRTAMLSIRVQR